MSDYLKRYWDEFAEMHEPLIEQDRRTLNIAQAIYMMGASAALGPLIEILKEEGLGQKFTDAFISLDAEIITFFERDEQEWITTQ